jgi:hypothetical protein
LATDGKHPDAIWINGHLLPKMSRRGLKQMGPGLAFKDLAQYEPTLTADKLEQIDAALAKAQEK